MRNIAIVEARIAMLQRDDPEKQDKVHMLLVKYDARTVDEALAAAWKKWADLQRQQHVLLMQDWTTQRAEKEVDRASTMIGYMDAANEFAADFAGRRAFKGYDPTNPDNNDTRDLSDVIEDLRHQAAMADTRADRKTAWSNVVIVEEALQALWESGKKTLTEAILYHQARMDAATELLRSRGVW